MNPAIGCDTKINLFGLRSECRVIFCERTALGDENNVGERIGTPNEYRPFTGLHQTKAQFPLGSYEVNIVNGTLGECTWYCT